MHVGFIITGTVAVIIMAMIILDSARRKVDLSQQGDLLVIRAGRNSLRTVDLSYKFQSLIIQNIRNDTRRMILDLSQTARPMHGDVHAPLILAIHKCQKGVLADLAIVRPLEWWGDTMASRQLDEAVASSLGGVVFVDSLKEAEDYMVGDTTPMPKG